MVAELSKENDLKVEAVRGGLGEFSVSIDGQKVLDTNRFWYPTPGNVVTRIRTLLATERS